MKEPAQWAIDLAVCIQGESFSKAREQAVSIQACIERFAKTNGIPVTLVRVCHVEELDQ